MKTYQSVNKTNIYVAVRGYEEAFFDMSQIMFLVPLIRFLSRKLFSRNELGLFCLLEEIISLFLSFHKSYFGIELSSL